MNVALILALLAPLPAQSDESKPAVALYQEAARLEALQDPGRALPKYKKAVDKAVAEGRGDVAAKALLGVARCNENAVPENIQEALSAYERVASEFSAQAEEAAVASAKAKLKGVDVMLRKFAASVSEWRDKGRSSAAALDEKKQEARSRILPLDLNAVPGLVDALGHPDELVRAFAAETLADVIDEAGVAALVAKLNEKGATSGAALALNKIFVKWNLAKTFDDQARGIQEDLDKVRVEPLLPQPEFLTQPGFQEMVERNRAIQIRNPGDPFRFGDREVKLRQEDIDAAKAFTAHLEDLKKEYEDIRKAHDEARKTNERNLARGGELTAKAKEIRHNLPQALNGAGIQAAFAALIADEGADAPARIEACKCMESIGDLDTQLVDAVVKGLSSPDRNVRRAAGVAAGAADPAHVEDRQRLVSRLMEIVSQVAETDPEQKDPANDGFTREAACESLGRIGTVRAVPAIVAALSDPIGPVRERANLALMGITGRDFGFESEPLVSDPGAKDPATRMDEKSKRQKQIEVRKQAIAKWEAWWNDTSGVGAVVDRFYKVAANWKSGDPSRLFDREGFLKEVKSQSYAYSNPQEALDRATRAVDRFQRSKDFLIQDLVELGGPAADKLTKFLSGVVDGDPRKIAAAPTRLFVAEAIARIAEKQGDSALAGRLRDLLGGSGGSSERAGAALALGALPKSMVGQAERDVLEKRGLSAAEAELREAASRALAAVGTPENGAALTAVAADVAQQSTKEGVKAAVAALRAIAVLKPKGGADIVRKLSGLVGHEPAAGQPSLKSPNDLVREYACEALGEIGDPLAIVELGLIRGRRDSGVNVRDAASRAIGKILLAHPEVTADIVKILKDAQQKSDDRRGAAFALESAGANVIQPLAYTVGDENPPIKMADPDPSVRAAACRTLGAMAVKAKYKVVGEVLISALDPDREISEEVRREAYLALRAIAADAKVPEFNPTDTTELRRKAANFLKVWFTQQQGWKE